MSKEFKIGLLTLISGVMLYTGVNFLKGSDFFSSDNEYYAFYQNVSGLNVSSAVKLNGLVVGRVDAIEIDKDRIKVSLHIRKDIKIGKNSVAMLAGDGLLGGKMIDLKLDRKSTPLENHTKIKSDEAKDMIAEVTQKADPIIAKVDSILGNVNGILKEFKGMGGQVGDLLVDVNLTAKELNGLLRNNQGNLSATMTNFKTLSSNLVQTERSLKPSLDNLNKFTSELSAMELQKTVDGLNTSLAQLNDVLTSVNQGEGSLGALLKDKGLYNNLDEITENLNKIMVDLRANPKRYVQFSVFGKKEKSD